MSRITGPMRRRKGGICKIFVSFKQCQAASGSSGCADRCRLGGLLDDSVYEFESFRRIGGHQLKMSYVHQPFLNRIERLTGASQDGEEILLGDGTIGGVNEVPPAANGFLDLNLCLFADDQSVD